MTHADIIAIVAARAGRELTEAEVAAVTSSVAAQYNGPAAPVGGGTGFLEAQINGEIVDHITASMLT
jgi:hypothetical protein